MICYRDMTFCKFYTDCQAHIDNPCHRALTDDVKNGAAAQGSLIAQFGTEPACYVQMTIKARYEEDTREWKRRKLEEHGEPVKHWDAKPTTKGDDDGQH